MGLFELILTFLGGGALSLIFSFIINSKKENRIDQQDINNNLFKEIGRLSEKIEKLEKEKNEKNDQLLLEKEKSYKLEVQLEDLRKDYGKIREQYLELKKDYEELKLLLIKKEK